VQAIGAHRTREKGEKQQSELLYMDLCFDHFRIARLAQLAERKALNLVVVGSTPTSGENILSFFPKTMIYLKTQSCKNRGWKRRVSIPVPRACEARALPIELRSHGGEGVFRVFIVAGSFHIGLTRQSF